MTLQDCRPLAAIVVRLQGEGMADLLYADSLPALHGFGYMKILWLQFQLEVVKVQSLLCSRYVGMSPIWKYCCVCMYTKCLQTCLHTWFFLRQVLFMTRLSAVSFLVIGAA